MEKKRSLKNIHILIIILGTLFIFLSLFHTNLWFDEAYSVGLANQKFIDIWKIGAKDVHPVLYYWLLRIINLATNGSILAYRLFSAIPIVLLGGLGYTHIKKDFGEKTGIIFSFLCYFLPFMVVYANKIRMYSWAMYTVGVLCIYAYRIYLGESTKKNWIIFGISSLLSIYIHYYGLMTAGLINIFLLIYFIKNKKLKELKWQITLGIIQFVLYLPWMIYLIQQIEGVSNFFWITFQFPYTLLEIVGFQMTGVMDRTLGFASNILLFVLLGIILVKKRKNIDFEPVIYGILIYLLVIIFALIISLILKTPVLYYRYLSVLAYLYVFVISYILSKVNNIKILLIICLTIFVLGITNNSMQIKENYAQDNGKQIEYLKANIQKEDVFVYANIDVGAIFASNFPENKQYFLNFEPWLNKEAYLGLSPKMEIWIEKKFIDNCDKRVWIIEKDKDVLYQGLFDNEYFRIISQKKFETTYRGYTYNITLVERVKK